MADAAVADVPAAPKDESRAPSASAFAWADGFMDVVAKYERASERPLYVYGISVSRCAYCRHRLKSGAPECKNCGHVVSTKSKTCTRCEAPRPGLWCYECDTYFCEACHRKPHVLVLGGGPLDKHHCYPTDGSSGKMLHHGAWSSSLMTMAKNARRSQMKLRDDAKAKTDEKKKAAKANGKENLAAVESGAEVETLCADEKSANAEKKPAAKETANRRMNRASPASTATSAQPTTVTDVSAPTASANPPARSGGRSRSPSPAPSVSSAQPEPRAQQSRTPSPTKLPPGPTTAPKPPIAPTRPDTTGDVAINGPTLIVSRKRKSLVEETTSVQVPLPQRAPAPPPEEASLPPPTVPPTLQPSTELSGMSLYLQVREMKNKLFQRQHPASSSVPTTATLPSGSQQIPHTIPSAPLPKRVQPSVTSSVHTSGHAVQPTPVSAATPSPPPAIPQPSQPSVSAMRPDTTGVPSTSNALPVSTLTTGSDDPLRSAMVERYDLSNIHVTRLEKQLSELNEAVRRASLQDMSAAAKINEHVAHYRAQVRSAEEQRERALAKAIIFSPEVCTFANNLPPEKWMDVPLVLAASHSKCAELALSIRKSQLKLQRLQKDIEDIVSTADPTQLAQLPALGKGIAGLQEQIRTDMSDRDDQFQLMYQFNPRLRELVAKAQLSMKQRGASGQAPS